MGFCVSPGIRFAHASARKPMDKQTAALEVQGNYFGFDANSRNIRVSFSRNLLFMLPERRREVRHRVHRPAYASLGEGMPLMILDAHERGLALESCSRLPVSTCVT